MRSIHQTDINLYHSKGAKVNTNSNSASSIQMETHL